MIEPTTEPGQSQSNSSDPKPKRDAGQTYILSCFNAVKMYRPAYLTPEDEARLFITVVPLDLRSDGNATDGGPRFIKPASRDAMNKFVERNKPWETYDLNPIRWDEEDDPKQNQGKLWVRSHRWHTGDFMLATLQHFALEQPGHCSYFNDDIDADPIYEDRFSSSLIEEWAVSFFMMHKDESKPHVSAFLTDGSPLCNDVLTTGEIAVATRLIALRRCYQGFNGHRYIPVTIFSASDRQIRVVQAYHDREEPRALRVRRSRIMEFWNGARGNWEDWITILCWMMGGLGEVE